VKIKHPIEDKIFIGLNYIYLTLILIVVSYPLIIVLSNSFSSPEAVTSGKVWLLPVKPSLEGYMATFRNPRIVTGYGNSFFYMVVGTLINLVVTLICAYPLSRRNLPGRRVLIVIFTFTMFFGGGLIPLFILINNLGMYNTRWAIIIPSAMSVWNMLVMRTYFMTSIPEELYDASVIDGCDEFRYIIQVLIPLSGPILAVIGLFSAVGHWNSYFSAMIFLTNKELHPLQLVLREILIMNNVSIEMLSKDPTLLKMRLNLIDVLKYAVIVVASAPLIIIYPFVQKFFVKGIMIGSLKG
jgi:putative aldouronate transport system permease protein